MGIKGLTKLLADNAPGCMKEQKLESYFGRKIAIDASMSIYQFLIVVGRQGTETLTNEAGEVTSHLQGMFTRTIRILEAGLKPVYVFDGKPPDLKREELKKRYARREDATEGLQEAKEEGKAEDVEKYSKRTVRVTRQHNEDCRRLLRLMGVPVIEAPSEAEAECANLAKQGKKWLMGVPVVEAQPEAEAECANVAKQGKVFGVASEDMDALTFGAPKFLRHLMEPAARKLPVMEFDVSKVLEDLSLTMDEFIDLCILCGCDYCDSIRGVGPTTALKLIRQHKNIESILEKIGDKYQVPDPWPYDQARTLFKEPLVTPSEKVPEIKWTAPDEEGLVKFLVEENGFNLERVTKIGVVLQAFSCTSIDYSKEKGASTSERRQRCHQGRSSQEREEKMINHNESNHNGICPLLIV
ncbi:hypothetical protein CLOM_g11318 [Closterium sp. NIES-68]|nr:hypothetical protein CLOM_g11318 [Closterium sp. NIES-68]GJP77923.1 hypothetical protein CLOP_g8249 [Closterium sp. NIES-67]